MLCWASLCQILACTFSPDACALWLRLLQPQGKGFWTCFWRQQLLELGPKLCGCSCFAVGSVCPCPYLLTQRFQELRIFLKQKWKLWSLWSPRWQWQTVNLIDIQPEMGRWWFQFSDLKKSKEIGNKSSSVVPLLCIQTKQWNGPLL